MNVEIDTSELKILEDFFKDLSKVDEKRIFISAFRKAAMPLIAAAKTTVPVERGNLWRSIGTKTIRGDVALWAGTILNTPYITKKGSLSKVWYGRLVENGFKKRGGRGRVEGTHWFRRAFEMTEKITVEIIEKEWHAAIERFIKRTNLRTR